MTQIAEEQKQKDIEERGSVSPAYEKAYKFGLTAVGQSVSQLDNILLWLLFSLISAAILKTKNPNTEVEESKL